MFLLVPLFVVLIAITNADAQSKVGHAEHQPSSGSHHMPMTPNAMSGAGGAQQHHTSHQAPRQVRAADTMRQPAKSHDMHGSASGGSHKMGSQHQG